MKTFYAGLAVMCLLFSLSIHAAETTAPWGSATEVHQQYSKQKVVFDTTTGSTAGLANILDRASYLSQLNGADPFENKIVIVLHGGSIPIFASKNYKKNKELMVRAQSLSIGDVIEFRMCKASAQLQGFTAKDIHGFVKMVPMADAEIVRLQQEEGLAYMR